jgi:hypothetical protein
MSTLLLLSPTPLPLSQNEAGRGERGPGSEAVRSLGNECARRELPDGDDGERKAFCPGPRQQLQTCLFCIVFVLYTFLKILLFKGTAAWDLLAFFWHVWVNLGLKVNRFLFQNCSDATSIFGSYSSFNAFLTKPSQRCYKSPRWIDN